MSRTIKSAVVVFTILCAIFLIIFSVELILLNRDSENNEGAPALSGGQPPGNRNSDADVTNGSGETNAQASAGGDGAPDRTGESRPPAPAGTRYEQIMPDGTYLVYYVDGELFGHTLTEEENTIDLFSFGGDETAGLEIRFAQMPQGINAFARDFLETDFGVVDSSVEGEESIRNSTLKGIYSSGTGNEALYEAWIHSFSDREFDDMGVIFIISYQNEIQRSALYRILDTLEMASLADSGSNRTESGQLF